MGGGHTLPLTDLGYTYAVAGKPAGARKMLERLEALAEDGYVSPYNMATIHVGLGEIDDAFVWLEKAFAVRSRSMTWLKVANEYDGLHTDPRFVSLLRRVGLPEWAILGSVRAAVAGLEFDDGENASAIDPDWGEPGLSAAEKMFAWNSSELLALKTGSPEHPINAVPRCARATCHLRYVVPSKAEGFVPALRRHLDANGFGMVEITPESDTEKTSFRRRQAETNRPS